MAHVLRVVAAGGGDPKRKAAGPVRARPTSPAGGGGPGHFRDADSFRADEKRSETVRHAKAPAARLKVSAPAASGTAKIRKAPVTKPYAKQLVAVTGPAVAGGVRLEVLADQMNDPTIEPPSSAETKLEESYEFGDGSWQTVNGKITSITKKMVFRASFTIRTHYLPGASPNDTSKYGRGTTRADKAAGNVTLGFHESCHRDEYIKYLTSTPYPKFKGKVGMTEEEFAAAVEEFDEAVKAFHAGIHADSLGEAVDEVGDCTKSDWEAGRCK
jgi:hypothetical protein